MPKVQPGKAAVFCQKIPVLITLLLEIGHEVFVLPSNIAHITWEKLQYLVSDQKGWMYIYKKTGIHTVVQLVLDDMLKIVSILFVLLMPYLSPKKGQRYLS